MTKAITDAFLVSHRINQRQRMQKYTCCCPWHVWWPAFKFSPLHLVSSFWLSSVHLFLAIKFISQFIWVNVRWNGPTWQAKFMISYFAINTHWKRRTSQIGIERENQSASQECRFATPTHTHTKETELNLRLGPRLRAGPSNYTNKLVEPPCLSTQCWWTNYCGFLRDLTPDWKTLAESCLKASLLSLCMFLSGKTVIEGVDVFILSLIWYCFILCS